MAGKWQLGSHILERWADLYAVKLNVCGIWGNVCPVFFHSDSCCFCFAIRSISVNYQLMSSLQSIKVWEKITPFAGLEKDMIQETLFWNLFCMSHVPSIQSERLEMPVQKLNGMEDCTISAQLFSLLGPFHAPFLLYSGITQWNTNSPFADPETCSQRKQQYSKRES